MKVEIEIEIEAIGARGDGIATLEDGRRVYVPYTVPGDRVRVRLGQARPDGIAGRAIAFAAEGPGRGPAACRHFGTCGGCALQHLDGEHYRAWKLDLLHTALARQDIEVGQMRDLFVTPPGTRRRADFTAVRRKNDLVFGFNARLAHQVVDLAECPVLRAEIVALIAPLRELLAALLEPASSAEVIVTWTDSGLDVLLATSAQLGLKRQERLAAFAEVHDLARLARLHPKGRGSDMLVERRPVRVRFDDVAVAIPPGAFLQASTEGENALRQAVREAVGASRHIVDLYAGCGTFGLSLAAAGRRVRIVEGDRHLVAAAQAVVRESGGRLRLTAEERDLDRRPLRLEEMAGVEAVIFDPPRAGARAQAEALAESAVPRIAAVSCNPATFARDAGILVDSGYRLDWVQPVDQFLWSPHLELVAAFSGPGRKPFSTQKNSGTRK